MNSSDKKSVFKISLVDVYFLIVTLAYLIWRFRVIWERMAG